MTTTTFSHPPGYDHGRKKDESRVFLSKLRTEICVFCNAMNIKCVLINHASYKRIGKSKKQTRWKSGIIITKYSWLILLLLFTTILPSLLVLAPILTKPSPGGDTNTRTQSVLYTVLITTNLTDSGAIISLQGWQVCNVSIMRWSNHSLSRSQSEPACRASRPTWSLPTWSSSRVWPRPTTTLASTPLWRTTGGSTLTMLSLRRSVSPHRTGQSSSFIFK